MTTPRKKLPPQHIGCRSTIRALLKGVEEPMADQRTPRTLRNYDAFLRTQSVAAQTTFSDRRVHRCGGQDL
jgi:hypothetical protein